MEPSHERIEQFVGRLSRRRVLKSCSLASALRATPRHAFVPAASLNEAYSDSPFVAIRETEGEWLTATQPSVVVAMLERSAASSGDCVLEIGTGSGYITALLARLVAPKGFVVSVDIDARLVRDARAQIDALGIAGVELRCGDGTAGAPERAPYDLVLSSVAFSMIPRPWIDQLRDGGRIIVPLTLGCSQLIAVLRKRAAQVDVESFWPIEFMMQAAGQSDSAQEQLDSVMVSRAGGPCAGGRLAGLLAEPATTCAAPEQLVPTEVWAGFALWLARFEPSACRICYFCGPGVEPAVPIVGRLSASHFTLAWTLGARIAEGLALLNCTTEGRTDVRCFGDAREATRCLTDAIARWIEAGRPLADAWRLSVDGDTDPVPTLRLVERQTRCDDARTRS